MKTSRLVEGTHGGSTERALLSGSQPGVDASEVPDDLLTASAPQFTGYTLFLIILRLLPHPTDLAHIPLGYVPGRFGLPQILLRAHDSFTPGLRSSLLGLSRRSSLLSARWLLRNSAQQPPLPGPLPPS